MDSFALRGNALWCEGVPLERIAAEVGTPVYVYSTATFVRHARVHARRRWTGSTTR